MLTVTDKGISTFQNEFDRALYTPHTVDNQTKGKIINMMNSTMDKVIKVLPDSFRESQMTIKVESYGIAFNFTFKDTDPKKVNYSSAFDYLDFSSNDIINIEYQGQSPIELSLYCTGLDVLRIKEKIIDPEIIKGRKSTLKIEFRLTELNLLSDSEKYEFIYEILPFVMMFREINTVDGFMSIKNKGHAHIIDINYRRISGHENYAVTREIYGGSTSLPDEALIIYNRYIVDPKVNDIHICTNDGKYYVLDELTDDMREVYKLILSERVYDAYKDMKYIGKVYIKTTADFLDNWLLRKLGLSDK